jgi:hypothetical protein
MINEIIGKLCPTTIMLNIGAIGIGMTETEQGLKILSYLVAILYTVIKIRNEIKINNKNKNK